MVNYIRKYIRKMNYPLYCPICGKQLHTVEIKDDVNTQTIEACTNGHYWDVLLSYINDELIYHLSSDVIRK
jgi:hypothetical protein